MGFGIMLIGYFIAFATSLLRVYFFADIVGFAVMTYASLRLSETDRSFRNSALFCGAASAVSLAAAVVGVMKIGGVAEWILGIVRTAVILMIHVTLMTSLCNMARGADDTRLAGRTRRNLYIVAVYYAAYILRLLLTPVLDAEFAYYIDGVLYLTGVVTVVLNLLLLHSAYARLYIEGSEPEVFDAVPEPKKSRFKTVNRIRERFFASQKKAFEENYRMMRDADEYAKAHAGERRGKKKKKK